MSDDEWAFFERFILAVRAPNGRKPTNHRTVLDGVFWIARTGSPWRDLPERYGPYTTAYNRYNRWAKAGVWLRVFEALAAASPQSPLFSDHRFDADEQTPKA